MKCKGRTKLPRQTAGKLYFQRARLGVSIALGQRWGPTSADQVLEPSPRYWSGLMLIRSWKHQCYWLALGLNFPHWALPPRPSVCCSAPVGWASLGQGASRPPPWLPEPQAWACSPSPPGLQALVSTAPSQQCSGRLPGSEGRPEQNKGLASPCSPTLLCLFHLSSKAFSDTDMYAHQHSISLPGYAIIC